MHGMIEGHSNGLGIWQHLPHEVKKLAVPRGAAAVVGKEHPVLVGEIFA